MRRLIPITLILFCLTTLVLVGMLAFLRQKSSTAGWIAYMQQSYYSGGRTDLYLMSPDGNRNQLVYIDVDPDFTPIFSPNGIILLFVHGAYSEDPQFCFFDLKTTETDCFPSSRYSFWRSAWLPNSKGLLFVENNGLYHFYLEGMTSDLLADLPYFDDLLSWTPNGKQMIYITLVPDTAQKQLYQIDANGGTSEVFLKSEEYYLFNGSWSFDGQWLAVNQGYWRYQNAPLLLDRDGKIIYEFPETLTWKTWTSDNQLVLTDESTLYLADPKIFKMRAVLKFYFHEGQIILSPDRQWLIFTLMDEFSNIKMYRLNLNTLDLEPLFPEGIWLEPADSATVNLNWHAEWLGLGSGAMLLVVISMRQIFRHRPPVLAKMKGISARDGL